MAQSEAISDAPARHDFQTERRFVRISNARRSARRSIRHLHGPGVRIVLDPCRAILVIGLSVDRWCTGVGQNHRQNGGEDDEAPAAGSAGKERHQGRLRHRVQPDPRSEERGVAEAVRDAMHPRRLPSSMRV